MTGTIYFPFKPAKGQSFRLSLSTIGVTEVAPAPHPLPRFLAFSSLSFSVSKDNGAFNSLTNAPVQITTGKGYVDLTASEMNADVLMISASLSSNSSTGSNSLAQLIVIYTTAASSGGLSLSDTVSNITDLPSSSPTLGEAVSFLYQYFKKRRNRNSWSFTRHITRG